MGGKSHDLPAVRRRVCERSLRAPDGKGVPFNGTGHSGMGAYHGVWGFREFTHPSTVLYGKNHLNLPLREHPYEGKKGEYKVKILRLFER